MINVDCIFCELAKEDRQGGHTLVGVLGPLIEISTIPAVLPNLCIFVRFHVPVKDDFALEEIIVRLPDKTTETIAVGADGLNQSFRDMIADKTEAKSKNNIYNFAVNFTPFSVGVAGTLKVFAKYGKRRRMIGELVIRQRREQEKTDPVKKRKAPTKREKDGR